MRADTHVPIRTMKLLLSKAETWEDERVCPKDVTSVLRQAGLGEENQYAFVVRLSD